MRLLVLLACLATATSCADVPDARHADGDRDGRRGDAEVHAGANPRFPGASSAGVPAGTALSAYTGPSTITTADTVIDGKAIDTCLRIQASGVVIRNSKVTCHDGGAVEVRQDEGGGLLIEDSEITCASGPGTALQASNFTARRLNIWGCENGGSFDHDITFEDSYIHDLYEDEVTHTDGIQLFEPVSNVTIRNNTIISTPGASSAIISPQTAANILIEHNLLAGGGFALYCPSDAARDVQVTGNRFSTDVWPKGGSYGPATGCGDATVYSDNLWHDGPRAGTPIPP